MKYLISTCLIITTSFLTAQSKVTKALLSSQNGDHEVAAKLIDKACSSKTHSEDSKAWQVKGHIYFELTQQNHKSNFEKGVEYALTATQAYHKAKSFTQEKEELKLCDSILYDIGNYYRIDGDFANTNKDYKKAALSWGAAVQVGDLCKKIDSLAIYNKALAHFELREFWLAVPEFERCIKLGYMANKMYFHLLDLYKRQGKTTQMLEAIEKGLAAFPKDKSILSAEINHYKEQENQAVLEQKLLKAVGFYPNDHQFNMELGVIYESQMKYGKAIKYYEKAVEAKPDEFFSTYNLGAIYFNQAIEEYEFNNANPYDRSPDKKLKKGSDYFKRAFQLLKAAEKLNPDSQETLMALEQLYIRFQEPSQVKRVQKRLRELSR